MSNAKASRTISSGSELWVGCLDGCSVDGILQQEVGGKVTGVGKELEKIRDDAEMVSENATAKGALEGGSE